MATLRYDVDVDARRAEARIGAFALDMRRRITQAVRSLPEIEIDADSTPAQRELARIRRELIELANQRIGVDIDAADAQRRLAELNAQLEELGASSGDIQIDADVAAARAALEEVNAEVDHLDGRRATVKVDVDKSLADTIVQVAALGRALKTLALPASAAGMIPVVAGIAASIGDLSGAAGLLPAAGAVAAAVMGTLATGFAHVSDALGPTGTPAQIKKVNEALAALSPNARAAVEAVRGLGPVWTTLRLDVQQRLFAGLSGEVKALGGQYLPVLKTGLGGIATELNDGAKNFAVWARSGETVSGVNTILAQTRVTMHELAPAGTNVAAALMDVGVVGSRFLPALATYTTGLTARFREFVAQARESGQLQEWIQNGITKVEQLGRVAGNVGGSLAAFFTAANASGHDFLDTAERITAEVESLLRSQPAQTGIAAFFRETGATADAALPGIRGFAVGLLQAVTAAANTGGLHTAGQALTDILNAVTPLLPALGKLAGETLHGLAVEASAVATVLGPVVHFLVDMLAALGPVGPAILGMVLAFRGLAPIGGMVAALGQDLGALAGRLGASEASAGRIATVFSRVGGAIPILGAAIIGLGLLYDALRDKTDETATAVLKGSADFSAAVNAMADSTVRESQAMETSAETTGRVALAHQAAARAVDDSKTAAQAHTEAVNTLVTAMRAQVDQMTGVEQAQGRVKIAQVLWNDAVAQFGPDSSQAAVAAGDLATASNNLRVQQDLASAATKTLTDRIVENSQASSAAANADVAYQQAVLNVANANDNAAKVAATRGVSERDLAAANLQVMQANLQAADAARRKAEADGTAAGASNVAQLGAQAYKEELLRLADQAKGPTRQALLDMAAGTDVSARAASSAELAARAQKDELAKLAGEASGPLRNAINGARQDFDTLGGAHATAQQRAQAQKDELQKLANMASGPVKASLQAMADQVKTLPDGDFSVTATGVTAYRFTSTGEVLGTGKTGLADGGMIGGYAPGRDTQRFRSASGSVLDLSGGEAVMRPEWTRAVSPAYVNAANAAARHGGVAGVSSFLARTTARPGRYEGSQGDGSAFAAGGIYGASHQRLAMGGFVHTGPAYTAIPPDVHTKTAAEIRTRIVPIIQKQLQEFEAKAKAALAAAAAGGGPAGPTTAGSLAGLNWARTQVGKPYVWGAVGPNGYDCSGFMSAVVNVMRGRNPYSRVGATGNFPWAGFAPGMGEGLNIGAFRGNPGHMAGTIGGVNLESSGSVGVRVGGGARGASNSMFNIRAHLADQGRMMQHGEASVNLSGMPERVLSPQETRSYAGDGSGMVVAEVARLRADVKSLSGALAAAGGDTFNVYAQDAQEGVQSTRMLLRTLR